MTSLDQRRSALATGYAVCGLSIASSLSFFVSGVAPLPVLLYFPLSRRFGFHSHAAELSMDYYGRSLVALLCGCAAALIIYMLTAPRLDRSTPAATRSSVEDEGTTDQTKPAASDRQEVAANGAAEGPGPLGATLPLLAAYCFTAAGLAAGLFAYQLAARVPNPEPLPTAAHGPRI